MPISAGAGDERTGEHFLLRDGLENSRRGIRVEALIARVADDADDGTAITLTRA